MIEIPNMFILQELWTRQFGEQNQQRVKAQKESMLSNQQEITKMTQILQTKNSPEIPQNHIGQNNH